MSNICWQMFLVTIKYRGFIIIGATTKLKEIHHILNAIILVQNYVKSVKLVWKFLNQFMPN